MDKTCELCVLGTYPGVPCFPKGTETPMLYFVGEAPGPEESETGVPFIGKAGKYLHKILDSLGLNENNCRFFNLVRCFPKDPGDKNFRAPNDLEIASCNFNVLNDIYNTNPSVIVPIGATSGKFFVGEEFTTITRTRGKVFEYKIKDKTFKVAPTFHPSYLMRQISNTSIHESFIEDIKRCISIASGGAVSLSNTTEFKNENVLCKTYKEFDEFCSKHIDNAYEVAYDIETNAEEKTSTSLEIVGFSLASDSVHSCYVVLDSLDYSMSEKDKKLVEARLRKILFTKKIYTYNCMYELPCTLNKFRLEIPDIEDVFVMVKLVRGQAERYLGNNGLKARAHEDLNYVDWSKDVDDFFKHVSSNDYNSLKTLISRYYDNSDEILDLVKTSVDNGSFYNSDKRPSYGSIPYKIVGKYGGIDSAVLFELRDFYQKKMDELSSELKINMNDGYKYWMMHHYAGYKLETNGAYWNEDKAKDLESWCVNNMTTSLKHIIESDISKPLLMSSSVDDYCRHIMSDKISEILGDCATPKRLYKNSVDVLINKKSPNRVFDVACRLKIEPKKTGSYGLTLPAIKNLLTKDLNLDSEYYKVWYKNYISNVLNNSTSIPEMKKLINPTSTSQVFKDAVSNILITDEIKLAKIYSDIVNLFEQPDFDVGYYRGDGRKLVEFVDKISKMNLSNSKRLLLFNKKLNECKNLKFDNGIMKIINNGLSYSLESLDDNNIIELYNYFVVAGYDIEDESTWTDQFRWLYNFRVYKKCNKILSTYINGNKVGRGGVYLVDKESLSNGDKITKRLERFPDDHKIPEGKTTLLQSSFSVNNANTGRWKAGLHTIPAGELIKGIYTSRFKGGIIAAPDFAQAEVRCIAAAAGEEALIKAFKDGVDIHRVTASNIFNKPQSEVTSVERRFAKSCCLHGDTPIKLLDGTTHKIKDLVGSKDFWVYSFDLESNRIVPGKVLECDKTIHVDKLIKITLDDGTSFKCTLDHKILCRDGIYRKACNLNVGDSLMPINTRISDASLGDRLNGYEILIENDGSEIYTHRMVTDNVYPEKQFKSMTRHHKDFNKLNNSPDNIELMTFFDHRVFHHKHMKDALRNGVYNTEAARLGKKSAGLKRSEKLSSMSVDERRHYLKGFVNWDACRRKRMSDLLSNENKDYYNSRSFIGLRNQVLQLIRDLLENGLADKYDEYRPRALFPKWSTLPEFLLCDYDEIIQSAWHLKYSGNCPSKLDTSVQSELGKSHMDYLWNSSDDEAVEFRNKHSKVHRDYMRKMNSSKEYQRHAQECKILKFLNKLYHIDSDITESNYKDVACGAGFKRCPTLNNIVKTFGSFESALSKALVYNHYIVDIEIVYEDCDMYDMVVEDWHNYAIFTSPTSGIISSNTFAILYGEQVRTFANEIMNGDMDAAQAVFDGFFNSFPKVKDYIEKCHKLCKEGGKIPTLTGRYIDLSTMTLGDAGKVFRQSQNAPIQASSSDVAGVVLYKVCEFIEQNNFKSKPFCFIHDSIEIDIYPYECFNLLNKLGPLFNEFPSEEFGVPMNSDITLGISMGEESEVVELVGNDKDFNDVSITLKGFEDNIERVINQWNQVYKIVEVDKTFDEPEPEREYVPRRELFQKKAPVSRMTGTYRNKIKRRYNVVVR